MRAGVNRSLCHANAGVAAVKGMGQTRLMAGASTARIAAADGLMLQGSDDYLANQEGATAEDMAWHNKRMQ